jgi:hypothetical protein
VLHLAHDTPESGAVLPGCGAAIAAHGEAIAELAFYSKRNWPGTSSSKISTSQSKTVGPRPARESGATAIAPTSTPIVHLTIVTVFGTASAVCRPLGGVAPSLDRDHQGRVRASDRGWPADHARTVVGAAALSAWYATSYDQRRFHCGAFCGLIGA